MLHRPVFHDERKRGRLDCVDADLTNAQLDRVEAGGGYAFRKLSHNGDAIAAIRRSIQTHAPLISQMLKYM
jgi:hypothetical protein